MGLDRTRSTWADEPHPAPIPLSPTPRAPTVRPVPGPLSAAPQGRRHDFGPCSFRSLWSQRERVHPIPAPPPRDPRCWQSSCGCPAPQPPSIQLCTPALGPARARPPAELGYSGASARFPDLAPACWGVCNGVRKAAQGAGTRAEPLRVSWSWHREGSVDAPGRGNGTAKAQRREVRRSGCV